MSHRDIDRNEYPKLNLILWDRAERFVAPDVAFRMYEERWRFIDSDGLSDRERRLIDVLKDAYGHGCMLIA